MPYIFDPDAIRHLTSAGKAKKDRKLQDAPDAEGMAQDRAKHEAYQAYARQHTDEVKQLTKRTEYHPNVVRYSQDTSVEQDHIDKQKTGCCFPGGNHPQHDHERHQRHAGPEQEPFGQGEKS